MSQGKGDKRRPTFIDRQEFALRYDLAIGKLSLRDYKKAMKELKGKGIEK